MDLKILTRAPIAAFSPQPTMAIHRTERRLLLAAAGTIVVALQLGAACDVNNRYEEGPTYHDSPPPVVYQDGGPVYTDRPGYPDGPPPPIYTQPYPSGGPVYVPGPPVIVDDRPNRIPRWADQVRDGHGKQRWTADFDGKIYVYDAEKDFIPWTGDIRRGQEVVVRPDDDRITINDHPVYQQNLRRDGRYEIYFEPSGRRQQYPNWDPHHDRNPGPIPPGRGSPRDDYPRDGDHQRDIDHPRDNGSPRGVDPRDNNSPRSDRPIGGDDALRGAAVLQRGSGDLAVNQVPRDGTILIYDEVDQRVVYSRDLGRGNSFQMFPSQGFVNVNSKRADSVSLRRDHRYSLYFRNK